MRTALSALLMRERSLQRMTSVSHMSDEFERQNTLCMKPFRNVGNVYGRLVPIVARYLVGSVELQCDLVRIVLSIGE